MAIKARRNKGKSPCGTAVNTYALQTYRRSTFATPRTGEALGYSPPPAHSRQAGQTPWCRDRKAGRLRVPSPGRRAAAHSRRDASHTGVVGRTLPFTLLASLKSEGDPSANVACQALGGNRSLRRKFVLLDWKLQSWPNWLPPAPHHPREQTPAPHERVAAPFPRTLKGKRTSISKAPAHSCHLQFSLFLACNNHTTSPSPSPQDSGRSLSSPRSDNTLPSLPRLFRAHTAARCFCHKMPNQLSSLSPESHYCHSSFPSRSPHPLSSFKLSQHLRPLFHLSSTRTTTFSYQAVYNQQACKTIFFLK